MFGWLFGCLSGNAIFQGSVKKQIQNSSRPISAGKAKPKGCERRVIDPTESKCYFLRVGKKQVRNPPRPIAVGKDKPKEGERRAIDPKGFGSAFYRLLKNYILGLSGR